MKRLVRPTTIFVATVVLLAMTFVLDTYGSDSLYKYKFPCTPGDTCAVTTLNHGENAYDFDPNPPGGVARRNIIVVREGTFDGYFSDSTDCDENGGLGNYARISDIDNPLLKHKYAHLSSNGSLVPGQRVQQGDVVGVEGDTGHTHRFVLVNGELVHVACADHLHLTNISTVAGIDGLQMSQIALGGSYSSTNSKIGGDDPFIVGHYAIRSKYLFLGFFGGSSWAVAGWTHDVTGNQAGCPAGSHCQLYAHYYPNAQDGYWGTVQNFRVHPDAIGLQHSSIQWHRWSNSNPAFLVHRDDGFFNKWWNKEGYNPNNGLYYDIGLALMDRSGNYQRFHVGFVKVVFGFTTAQFCPDVHGGLGGPGTYNGSVSAPDFFAVLGAFGATAPVYPFLQWPDSWYDINGNGAVNATDFFMANAGFGLNCT